MHSKLAGMKDDCADMKSRFETGFDPSWMPEWIARVVAPNSTDTVEGVLRYLRDAAGFDIKIKSNVPLAESWHRRVRRAENEEEALSLLKEATAALGCTVVRKGRLLTILTAHDSKKECMPLPRWR